MGMSRAAGGRTLNRCVVEDVQANLAGGDLLDGETRRILERGFGTDLTEIRIHADSNADRLTRRWLLAPGRHDMVHARIRDQLAKMLVHVAADNECNVSY